MKVTAVLLALLFPALLHGQGPRHAIPVPASDTLPLQRELVDAHPERHELTLALGGALAGIGGLIAGGFIGARIELAGGCDGEWCGFGGALLGAAIGSAVMIPVGVHLANDGRGDLSRSVAASGLALAGGVALVLISHEEEPLLLIPLAQIIGSVAMERRTSRHPTPDRIGFTQSF